MPIADLTGQTFGLLTVVKMASAARTQAWWQCHCKCGTKCVVKGGDLERGHTVSCGCFRKRLGSLVNLQHGAARTGKPWPEYRVWTEMKQRCYNPKSNRYRTHGARGITVCARWRKSFQAFIEDMGRRPSSQHSLERRDNNGNYTPKNCYWATKQEQARNKRTTLRITYKGETKSLKEWCEIVGVKYGTAWMRHKQGWPVERILKP